MRKRRTKMMSDNIELNKSQRQVIELNKKFGQTLDDNDFKAYREALSKLSDEDVVGLYKFLKQCGDICPTVNERNWEVNRKRKLMAEFGSLGAEEFGEPSTYKPRKFSMFKYVSEDPLKKRMSGVMHHDGFAVATDGKVLIADKCDYNPEHEGNMVDKKGEFLEYAAEFPNWRGCLKSHMKNTKIIKDGVHLLAGQVNHIKAKRPDEDDAIAIRMSDDVVVVLLWHNMLRFVDAAIHIGATCLLYSDWNMGVIAENDNGVVMVAPTRLTDGFIAYIDLTNK